MNPADQKDFKNKITSPLDDGYASGDNSNLYGDFSDETNPQIKLSGSKNNLLQYNDLQEPLSPVEQVEKLKTEAKLDAIRQKIASELQIEKSGILNDFENRQQAIEFDSAVADNILNEVHYLGKSQVGFERENFDNLIGQLRDEKKKLTQYLTLDTDRLLKSTTDAAKTVLDSSINVNTKKLKWLTEQLVKTTTHDSFKGLKGWLIIPGFLSYLANSIKKNSLKDRISKANSETMEHAIKTDDKINKIVGKTLANRLKQNRTAEEQHAEETQKKIHDYAKNHPNSLLNVASEKISQHTSNVSKRTSDGPKRESARNSISETLQNLTDSVSKNHRSVSMPNIENFSKSNTFLKIPQRRK